MQFGHDETEMDPDIFPNTDPKTPWKQLDKKLNYRSEVRDVIFSWRRANKPTRPSSGGSSGFRGRKGGRARTSKPSAN